MCVTSVYYRSGADPGFQVGGGGGGGGAHLKKLHRADGGTKIVGVFRVKNHDFTPKNHIFSNFRPPPLGFAPVDPFPSCLLTFCIVVFVYKELNA